MSETISAQQSYQVDDSTRLAPSEKRTVLLVTTVDLGGGKAGKIKIYEGDQVIDVAKRFVKKYNLPDAVVGPLVNHLNDNMKKAEQIASEKLQQSQSKQSLVPRCYEEPSLYSTPPRSFDGGYSDNYSSQIKPPAKPKRTNRNLFKQQNREDIFEKLYLNAIEVQRKREQKRAEAQLEEGMEIAANKKGPSWISKQMMRNRTKGEFQSYGERLYVEGLIGKERRMQAVEQYQLQKYDQELDGVTFKPDIQLTAKSRSHDGTPTWQRLTEQGQQSNRTKQRLETIRKQQQAASQAECTFKPRINPVSSRLVNERRNEESSSAYDQLYNEAQRRQLRLQEKLIESQKEYSFQPTINQSSKSCGDGSESGTLKTTIERLYQGYFVTESRLAKQREVDQQIDPNTGQQLFHPATGRPPVMGVRNNSNLPIGDYLYTYRPDQTFNQQFRQQSQQDNAPAISPQSHQIIEQLKHRRLKQIFMYLDTEQSGVIELNQIISEENEEHFTRLDAQVQKDVQAAHEILLQSKTQEPRQGTAGAGGEDNDERDAVNQQDQENPATLKQFIQAMEVVIKRSKGTTRQYLQPKPHVGPPGNDCTFKPEISSKSRQIAEKKRQHASVYEKLHTEAMETKQKLEAKRIASEQETLSKYSFKPAVIASHTAAKGKAVQMAEQMTSTSRTGDDFVRWAGSSLPYSYSGYSQDHNNTWVGAGDRGTSRMGSSGRAGADNSHSSNGYYHNYELEEQMQQLHQMQVRMASTCPSTPSTAMPDNTQQSFSTIHPHHQSGNYYKTQEYSPQDAVGQVQSKWRGAGFEVDVELSKGCNQNDEVNNAATAQLQDIFQQFNFDQTG